MINHIIYIITWHTLNHIFIMAGIFVSDFHTDMTYFVSHMNINVTMFYSLIWCYSFLLIHYWSLIDLSTSMSSSFQMGQFYYAAKAFDVLERLDPNPEYWEGKRGACVGVFQMIIAGHEPRLVISFWSIFKLINESNFTLIHKKTFNHMCTHVM